MIFLCVLVLVGWLCSLLLEMGFVFVWYRDCGCGYLTFRTWECIIESLVERIRIKS